MDSPVGRSRIRIRLQSSACSRESGVWRTNLAPSFALIHSDDSNPLGWSLVNPNWWARNSFALADSGGCGIIWLDAFGFLSFLPLQIFFFSFSFFYDPSVAICSLLLQLLLLHSTLIPVEKIMLNASHNPTQHAKDRNTNNRTAQKWCSRRGRERKSLFASICIF